MEQALAELNKKIDALTAQVTYLADQAQMTERSREAGDELMQDVMPIARRVMDQVSGEMEDVQEYLQSADLVRTLKKLIRHLPQIEMLLDQLDSLTDLLEVMGPITKEGVDKLTEIMAEMESKGYFTLTRGGVRIVDRLAASLSEEDLNRLGDGLPSVLETVKEITKPEIINFMHTTLLAAEKEVQKPVDGSLTGLLRQMRNPAVRRGLALTLRLLQVIGEQAAEKI